MMMGSEAAFPVEEAACRVVACQEESRAREGKSAEGRSIMVEDATTRISRAATVDDVRDVAGVDEAKEELSEIVDILKNPERYSKLGARPPCGVLCVDRLGLERLC